MTYLPTKVRLRKCTIKGTDFRYLVNNITVYESMCKPYITAKITVVDNNNAVNTLQLRGGEKVSFAFDGGGRVYEMDTYILSLTGETSTQNLRTQIYQISVASESYFKDRANLVQKSFVNMPGTAAVQQIHETYVGGDAPLNILMPSLGLIAKDTIGSYITANVKPFKAIEDIAKKLTYGAYKTGSTVYFRNRDEYVFGPLEHIFNTLSPVESFIQKNTWGADWKDIFNSYNAIIAASAVVNEDQVGRGGSQAISAAMNQAHTIYDHKLKKTVIQKMGSQISAGAALGNAMLSGMKNWSKKHGGIVNVLQMDSSRNELSTDAAMNAPQEKLFQAMVKDSPNYIIKVPIQTGINCTVGRGVNAKLLAPHGDQNTGRTTVGGLMLVADLMHECYFDDRLVQATTTMRCVSGGYQV